MARKWTDLLDAAVGAAGMAFAAEKVIDLIPPLQGRFHGAAHAVAAVPALWLGWRFGLKSYFGNRAIRETEEGVKKATGLDVSAAELARAELKARAEGREIAGGVFDRPSQKP